MNCRRRTDVERVRERLAAKGWPLDDARDGEESRIAVLRAFAVAQGSSASPLLADLERGPERPGIRAGAGPVGADRLRIVCAAGGRGYRRRRRRGGDDVRNHRYPKGALLTAAALTASAEATHDRLGGPGRWLLALPSYHIAGIQVLVRSLLAGTVPVELDVSTGFDINQLPSAVARTRLGATLHGAGRHAVGQGAGRSGRRCRAGRPGRRADRRWPGPATGPRRRRERRGSTWSAPTA